MFVRPRFEPATSRTAVQCSTNWANRSVVGRLSVEPTYSSIHQTILRTPWNEWTHETLSIFFSQKKCQRDIAMQIRGVVFPSMKCDLSHDWASEVVIFLFQTRGKGLKKQWMNHTNNLGLERRSFFCVNSWMLEKSLALRNALKQKTGVSRR